MAKELVERSKVSVENTWNLKDMYESEADFNRDMEKATRIADKIAGMEAVFADSADNVYKVLGDMEELFITLSKVGNYAMCLSDQDTGNSANQLLEAKSESLYADALGKTAYVEPKLLTIPEETFAKYYELCPELKKYKHFIDESLRLKEHTLSPEIERIMALSSETRNASSNTFSLLNNADMKFPTVKDDKGEDIELSQGRFVGMLNSPDREVRKNTFVSYYGEYKKLINTYASLYFGQVKALMFDAKVHKYSSTLEAAVTANDVPSSVYLSLIEAVNKNIDALHAYVSLRKRLLGLDELHMYDIYVPMIADYDRKITFDEAKETALKALAPLGEDYIQLIAKAFNSRWIDIYENKGKRSGAYETCAYGCHPYVLLNFDGKFDDMFTLVHEMGHAMHSYYSDEAQEYFDSQYKIFVAEVASTTNELLLLKYLYNNSEDINEKKYLLNHYLDMFKGTLFRQTMFAEFELKTNRLVESGEGLNAENLNAMYLELNKKYYGKDMVSDDEIAYEWARIPHFYYNFYVYQYATSFAASVAIVERIENEGESAVRAYRDFLTSGCTKSPVELLKGVGVNLETNEPISKAIDVMRKTISELENL